MSPGTLSHGMVYGVVHRTDNNHKREMVVYGWSADQLKEEMNYIKEVSYSFSFKICQISLPFIHVELWVTIGQPTSRPTSKFESGTHFEVKCLPCWYSSLKNKTKQKHPLGTWELHVSNSSPLWQMIVLNARWLRWGMHLEPGQVTCQTDLGVPDLKSS